MQFDVVSLFPEMFAALTQSGVTRRAHEQGLWNLSIWNPRDFTQDRHRTVDDRPYGGGPGMVMMCGRYEAVDQRLLDRCVDEEISLGDFVLSGGELPAMALMDAVVRQLPGALGDNASAVEDSFVNGLLDSPHYTRPDVYEGVAVPPVLMGGNHAEIVKWRRQRMLEATAKKRPDLLDKARSAGQLNKADEKFLAGLEGAAE
jgi:tRNA (guanine37-N1)-methyltransferase